MTLPMKRFTEVAHALANGDSFLIQQRRALGVDASLDSCPVLYLSAHRGAFDAAFKGHREAFQRALSGEANEGEKEFGAVDLSSADRETLLDAIYYYGAHLAAPNTDDRLIGQHNADHQAEPLPGYIVSMIYLPPLDAQGRSIDDSSRTWALDAGNVRHILPKFAAFMRERGFIREDHALVTGENFDTTTGVVRLTLPCPEAK